MSSFPALQDIVKTGDEPMTKMRQKMRKEKQKLLRQQKYAEDAENAKTMWRGTLFGKPFFDLNYYTKKNPFYKDGVSTQTSKEMMRYFLEWVGGDDPSTYSQYGMGPKTTSYIWYVWEKLLGKKNEFGVAYNPIEPFRWFAELEPLITNDKMWWVLMKDVWTFNSSFFTEECFNRYGRLEVPFKDRTIWMEYLDVVDGKPLLRDGNFKSEYVNAAYDLMDDDEPLYVYRSFKVEKGKPIRKGLVKNSPYAHQQETGAGLSFTEHKSVAVKIADPINTYQYEKYGGIEEDDALDIMEKTLGERVKTNITYRKGFYSCLGLYRIKKSDILFYTDCMGEKEIIVQPRNAELIDYRFLNFVDYATTRLTEVFADAVTENESQSKSMIANTDALYDLIHRDVKRVFTQKPDLFYKILSPKFADGLKDLLSEVEDIFNNRMAVDVCEKPNGQRVGFWTIGNKPCLPISRGVRQRTTPPTMDTNALRDSLGAFQSV